jgi:hypothetical protein
MSQTQKIISYLSTGKAITAIKALEIAGTMRLAARISDIAKKGYPIVREWVVTPSNKRVMSYRFPKEYLDSLKKPFCERIKTFFDDLLKGGMFEEARV